MELESFVVQDLRIFEGLSDSDDERGVGESELAEFCRYLWKRRERAGSETLEMLDIAREGREDGRGEEVGTGVHLEAGEVKMEGRKVGEEDCGLREEEVEASLSSSLLFGVNEHRRFSPSFLLLYLSVFQKSER